jgi:integrase
MRASEKLARQDETDIQRAIEAGRAKATPKLRKMKIDSIYEEWHKATTPPIYANNTWQVYARFYKDYIKDVFGSRSVSEVTALHVQKYVNLMSEKYSPETVNKCLNILVDLFAFSVDVLKCISINPAAGIKRCKVPKKKKVTWSDAQIKYFLSLPEVQQSHYYPMLCLSVATGCRPGEVCGLTESCLSEDPYAIDFDRGYDNYEYETDMKTSGSHRTTPIPQYLYKLIHRRLIWKKQLHLAHPEWGDNDFLFVSQNGKPIKPHQYATGFRRLLTAHNDKMNAYKLQNAQLPPGMQELPRISLYGFRTSFATNNMRKTPNAALISSIMGNSPKTLIQFYTQSDTEMQAQMIENYVEFTPERTIS